MSKQRVRAGITIVEVLIALALSASLMAALCAAMVSVTQGARGNDSHLRARQSAEGVLRLMLTEVRRAKELAMEAPASGGYARLRVLDEAVWDAGSDQWSPANAKWSVFEVSNGQLTLTRLKSDASGAITEDGTYALSRHVLDTRFRSALDEGVNRSVIIDLTVECEDAYSSSRMTQFGMSGTAMARSLSKS